MRSCENPGLQQGKYQDPSSKRNRFNTHSLQPSISSKQLASHRSLTDTPSHLGTLLVAIYQKLESVDQDQDIQHECPDPPPRHHCTALILYSLHFTHDHTRVFSFAIDVEDFRGASGFSDGGIENVVEVDYVWQGMGKKAEVVKMTVESTYWVACLGYPLILLY